MSDATCSVPGIHLWAKETNPLTLGCYSQGRRVDLNNIIFLSHSLSHTHKIGDVIVNATKKNKVPKYHTHKHTHTCTYTHTCTHHFQFFWTMEVIKKKPLAQAMWRNSFQGYEQCRKNSESAFFCYPCLNILETKILIKDRKMVYGWNRLKASMMLVTSQHLVLWADLLLRYQRIVPQWPHISVVHLKWLRTHTYGTC